MNRLSAVDSLAADIRDNRLPSTRILGQVGQLAERLRSYQGIYFLADNDDERKTRLAKTALANKDLQTAIKGYQSFVMPGEEQHLAERMMNDWSVYNTLSAQLLDIIVEIHSDVDREHALLFYKHNMLPSMDAFRTALEANFAFNLRMGAGAAAEGKSLGVLTGRWILTAIILMAAICFLNGLSLVRGISLPITALTEAMRRLAAQHLEVEVPGSGRRDEIGAMSAAMQVFKDNALRTRVLEQEQASALQRRTVEHERVRREAEEAASSEAAEMIVGSIGMGLQCMAAGDLTYRIEKALPGAYEKLRTDLNGALGQLQGTMLGVSGSTSAIQSGSEEIAKAADDLSRRTEQQAASLEQTAAALDQITATVRKTASGAGHARDVVGTAKFDAERSGLVVRDAVTAMSAIEASSQKISQIIGVIDEIAFQTNLLALNAGVEAARAGDAGRGFAVVASEVRALAQRSADAAKEIKSLISASSQQVSVGVDLVGQTGKALERIVTQVAEINGVVAEIAASAHEQATGLAEVNTAVNQMDQVTQQNAAMVEQSTAASHSLMQEAKELGQLIGQFQVAHEGEPARRPLRKSATPMRTPVAALKVVAGRGVTKRKLEPVDNEGSWKEF